MSRPQSFAGPPLPPGRAFGPFVLVRKLAESGMAEVFLAKRVGPGGFERNVVIKRMLRHLSALPDFVDMFHDEAMLAARLAHPNIIHIEEPGFVDGYHFICMEYLAGEDFCTVLRRGAQGGGHVPLPVVLRVLVDAAHGLHHAHEQCDEQGRPLGVVHRDVSPSNLFLTYQGQVKVLDFGIAKAGSRNTQTDTGVVKGKYSYMAPEQARGGEVDRRADVYSLGVSLYEALTGVRPFARDHALAVLNAVLVGDAVPPRQLRPELPEALEALVLRAMATEPTQRFATAAALAEALEAFAHAHAPLASSAQLAAYLRGAFGEERVLRRSRIPTLATVLSGEADGEDTALELPGAHGGAAHRGVTAVLPAEGTQAEALAPSAAAERTRVLAPLAAPVGSEAASLPAFHVASPVSTGAAPLPASRMAAPVSTGEAPLAAGPRAGETAQPQVDARMAGGALPSAAGSRLAEGGTPHVTGPRVAEGSPPHVTGRRVAEGSPTHVAAPRVAEASSPDLTASRGAEAASPHVAAPRVAEGAPPRRWRALMVGALAGGLLVAGAALIVGRALLVPPEAPHAAATAPTAPPLDVPQEGAARPGASPPAAQPSPAQSPASLQAQAAPPAAEASAAAGLSASATGVTPAPARVRRRQPGVLGAAEIQRVVTRGQAGIMACFEKHKADLPADEGEVRVRLDIADSGQVQAHTRGPLAETAVGRCLEAQVQRLRFSPHRDALVSAEQPFRYRVTR